MQIRHFRRFRQNGPFGRGQEHGLPKTQFVPPRVLCNGICIIFHGSGWRNEWVFHDGWLSSLAFMSTQIEAQNHPKSRNTKKTSRLHELFRKARVNLCLIPCDTCQEPDGNWSERLVQMKLLFGVFFLGGGWIFLLSSICTNSKEQEF